MTHRQTLEALSGMLLAMFTAFLSSTIVSNALPTIITDLHGTQHQYTWVITATLLSSTASTPIWGKLADLFSKKLLVQLSILIFTVGSVLAGLAQSVDTLIAWRAVQGLGLGGLQSLVIIAIAAMISPRERGRYTGPIAAVMSDRSSAASSSTPVGSAGAGASSSAHRSRWSRSSSSSAPSTSP
jgi:MFS family permease